MNAVSTHSQSFGLSALTAFLLALTVGGGLLALGGHVQAQTLHDAAHDVRHATGFPCH